MTLTDAKTSIEWLRTELVLRQRKNPAYTLRSFARHLEMPSGRVSEILSTKRRLTLDAAERIADRLGYVPDVRSAFLELVRSERSTKGVKRAGATKAPTNFQQISEEVFEVIADWQYFAILNLMKVSDFRNDARWIGNRLGLSVTEVRSAIDKLKRLALVEETADKKLVRTITSLITTYGVPSAAIRRSHKQSLEQAIAALDDVPMPLRDITSITFPADRSKIPQVKEQIKLFQRRMAKLMKSDEATAVYNLNVQLVPVTKERL